MELVGWYHQAYCTSYKVDQQSGYMCCVTKGVRGHCSGPFFRVRDVYTSLPFCKPDFIYAGNAANGFPLYDEELFERSG